MKNIQKIEDYLWGKLSAKEQDLFLQEVSENPALQEELQEQEQLLKSIQYGVQREIKTELDQIHYRLHPEKEILQKSRKTNTRISHLQSYIPWACAAALVLLLILAWPFLFGPKQNPDNFAQYYSPYPLPGVLRGHTLADLSSTESLQSTYAEAHSFYRNGQFENALPFFQRLLKVDSTHQLARLGLSICYIEKTSWQKAQQELETILQSGDKILQDQANWYLGLVLIRQEQFPAAKIKLQHLSETGEADYQQKAKALLEKLK